MHFLQQSLRRLLPCLFGLVVLLAGCLGGPGQGIMPFPNDSELLDSIEDLHDEAVVPAILPTELQKTVLPSYIVEPSDGLLIEPDNFDSPLRFPNDQIVLSDGTIDLGRYGRPLVAGKTLVEIEAIVQGLIENQDPDAGRIHVRLVNPQSKLYYVLGEVNAPGAFPLHGRETVLDAIIAAGGLTDRASPDHIILSRPSLPDDCRIVLPIRYLEIVQLGDTSTNYQIMPGDRIYVASCSIWEVLFDDMRRKRRRRRDCTPQHRCPDAGVARVSAGVTYSLPVVFDEVQPLPREHEDAPPPEIAEP